MSFRIFCLASLAVATASAYGQTGWLQHGRDPQHTGLSTVKMNPMTTVLWSTPIDLAPQYSGTSLLIHYMCPLITPNNTVVVPVKRTASGSFMVQGRSGVNGNLLWKQVSNWIMPPSNWKPIMGLAMFPNPADATKTSIAIADSAGKVIIRDDADGATSTKRTVIFYGANNYRVDKAAYDANVRINTPITADAAGNLYFGYQVTGDTPLHLKSGIAKIGANGVCKFKSAADATGDPNTGKVAMNCAPALRRDAGVLYFATNGGQPYLVALNTTTFNTAYKHALKDPVNGNPASVTDLSTATPMVASNGDVFYGIMENPFGGNHVRGYMLHFDKQLNLVKFPGAFGWDHTPSLIPASSVPSYTGSSPYLLLCKYNHYASTGGNGANKLAILDPNDYQNDPVAGIVVMKEVLTILSPTHDSDYPDNPDAVREWCINTVAVDRYGKAALVSCEDGKTYRWDFITNTLNAGIQLTNALGQAYTPTAIGPNGNGYAISNGILFCVGSR
ncbi:MAG TPA: hypothetical protein VK934_06360 [Fimbriimonas sp.]|nr:hypothetical protein [Fimbriimonas sp.]